LRFLLRCVACFVALWVTTFLFPAKTVIDSYSSLAAAAVVLGLINSTLRPIMQFLTLPIGCITMGISSFLINVLMVWLSIKIAPGITFTGFWTYAVATVLVSVSTSLISSKK
jgi:putative membrane protein